MKKWVEQFRFFRLLSYIFVDFLLTVWWEDFCDNAEVAATGEDITDAVEVLEPGLKSEHVWPIHGGLFELITPCFAFDITEQADCGLKRKKVYI